jgi:hypothetical protein
MSNYIRPKPPTSAASAADDLASPSLNKASSNERSTPPVAASEARPGEKKARPPEKPPTPAAPVSAARSGDGSASALAKSNGATKRSGVTKRDGAAILAHPPPQRPKIVPRSAVHFLSRSLRLGRASVAPRLTTKSIRNAWKAKNSTEGG